MRDQIADTYKYVRIITPLPAAWLLVSILVAAIVRHHFLESISDYYGGPLRDVFVGALMASAVGMIAYKGRSKLEDYALNFAGVNAFFVALISNSFQSLLDTTRAAEGGSAPPPVPSAELLQNLRIGVGVFLGVLVVFVAADILLMHWTRFRWSEQTVPTNVLIVISCAGELILLVTVVCMLFGLEAIHGRSIFSLIHFSAAALLIVNLSFAAASHAFPAKLRNSDVDAPPASPTVQWAFTVITALMWVGLAGGTVFIVQHTPYIVIIVEVWEIVSFLAFWLVATRAEWHVGPPPEASMREVA